MLNQKQERHNFLTQTTHVKNPTKTYIKWIVPSFGMKVKKCVLSKTTFQKNTFIKNNIL